MRFIIETSKHRHQYYRTFDQREHAVNFFSDKQGSILVFILTHSLEIGFIDICKF